MKKIYIALLVLLFIVITAFIILFIYNQNKGYEVIDINVKNRNGQNIYGVIYKPKKDGKVPVVIYSHGLGATYRAGSDYAKELAKYGIATVCFDFRGGSTRSKSDGLTTEMSFLTEMDDLEIIIDYVKQLDYIDTNNIILAGSSQGGAVSALVSSRHQDETSSVRPAGDIKGLILLYPALSIPEVMRNWYSSLDNVPNVVKLNDSIDVGKKYFEDIWTLDPFKEIKKDKTNILILHGTKDSLVPIEYSRKINNIYSNSTFYEIEGAGHGFNGEKFDEAMEHIIDYLKNIKVIND